MKLLIGLIFAILSVVSGQSSSTPSDQTSYKSISAKFVALRETSNREHLCWAIKIAPTAFVTAADCLKGYNKTQLFMTFGDIQPEAAEQKRLKNKLNVLMKNCRHQIENVALLVENKQSVLFKTVQNYLASYSLLGPVEKCSECSILKIQRRFNCPVKNVAVVFNNCTNHVESVKMGLTFKIIHHLEKSLISEQNGAKITHHD